MWDFGYCNDGIWFCPYCPALQQTFSEQHRNMNTNENQNVSFCKWPQQFSHFLITKSKLCMCTFGIQKEYLSLCWLQHLLWLMTFQFIVVGEVSAAQKHNGTILMKHTHTSHFKNIFLFRMCLVKVKKQWGQKIIGAAVTQEVQWLFGNQKIQSQTLPGFLSKNP